MKMETFKVLVQAGMPVNYAHAIAQALEIECTAVFETVATKVDLANLRADLRAEMHAMKSDLVMQMFLMMLGQTTMLAAAGYFYLQLVQ